MHLFRGRHGSSSFVNPTAHLTCPWSSSSVGIAFDDHGNAHDATEYMAHAIVKHCQRLRLHTHRVTHLPSFNFDDRFILALDHLPPPVLLSPIVSSLASRLNRLPAPIPDHQSEEYQDLFDYVLSSCIHDYVHGPLYPHQYSCDIALFHPDSPAMHVACIHISLTGRLPYFDILDAIKRSPYITFHRRFYYCTYPLANSDNVALIVTSSPDPVWIDSCTSVFCNHAMHFSPLWRFPGIYISLTRTLIPTFASHTVKPMPWASISPLGTPKIHWLL
ncbi:hypothetical protein EV368DRAFT_88754 [Lentinula lateritia]|nr:hypothetical protein EV368DRAFT_88754 [Lentinula lateritia]